MTKQEFLAQLCKGLSGLPHEDVEERLTFYSEMIDDRIEEGFPEDEAVSAIGSVDEITAQVVADIPLSKIAKERIRSERKHSIGEIILLVLGFPLWFPLLAAAFAVLLSLYISLWAVVVSLWAAFVSLAAGSVGGVISCVVFVVRGYTASGIAMLSAGIVCAGLSIFMFYGCMAISKGAVALGKKMGIWVKKCFIKKEAA